MNADSPLNASTPDAPDARSTGLLVLHGHRLELLREAVFRFVSSQPPGPLEEEVYLVQSNGIAEWLKMALARDRGVCAATRVELPARFLWRVYRAQLGVAGAPTHSPLDEAPLVWRLMRLLDSALIHSDGFEPLAGFLAPGDVERRLQLAQRLADLFDQYQVYRADWLQDWSEGRDVLRASPQGLGLAGSLLPVPADQVWQPRLWRVLLQELEVPDPQGVPGPGRDTLRPAVHRRFVEALHRGLAPARPLPRRVVLFGHSHLPLQTLEALEALSHRCQVILAVPNPCQFHWADIIDGRELLRAQRRRQSPRPAPQGQPTLSELPLESAHAQAHPLLAAWGRQGRDFVRLLDEFDDAQLAQARFAVPRVDLFDVDEAESEPRPPLLLQVQAAVRDLLPLAEHPRRQGVALADRVAPDDRSIAFHVAHGPQREVEVLHDQLLRRFQEAQASGRSLSPRDIVVMVPDIEPYAPVIRAVFGQVPRHDRRHIPFEITDVRQRGRQPLLVALEWLLRTPQRATASEWRDLLEVPALARRFGLADTDRALVVRWLDGAGVRWGLDATHRATLGLQACGEANTWAFGVRRMLMGFAVGRGTEASTTAFGVAEPRDPDTTVWEGLAPYDEVGGLDAALAGALAEMMHRLGRWWAQSSQPADPLAWAERARSLLDDFFAPSDERERLWVAGLHDALDRWVDQCDAAGFSEAVPLAVLREAWLGALDEGGVQQRFLGGGVTFCTLMPMRAIPFEVVCLLGMNDGDYPRRAPRSDFDLMGLPGVRRPGDRARRDDDRYLLLEALLSARRELYISWAGRSPRDQSHQPPSVLVAQLRDYLAAGWDETLPERLTTEHPMQAFSRRYFEPQALQQGLYTYAREWRDAHTDLPDASADGETSAGGGGGAASRFEGGEGPDSGAGPVEASVLDLATLLDFLRQPVRHHFRHVLRVDFQDEDDATLEDDERFLLEGLAHWQGLDGLLDAAVGPDDEAGGVDTGQIRSLLQSRLHAAADTLAAQGRLPLAGLGERVRRELMAQAEPMAQAWWRLRQMHPDAAREGEGRGRLRIALEWPDPAGGDPGGPACVRLEDWIEGLRSGPEGDRVRLARSPSSLVREDASGGRRAAGAPPVRMPRVERLLEDWLFTLVAAAQGERVHAVRLGRDAVVRLTPPSREAASEVLAGLLAAWSAGRSRALPLDPVTALAWWQALEQGNEDDADAAARAVYEGPPGRREVLGRRDRDAALRRAYPDFDTLLEGRDGPGLRAWVGVYEFLWSHVTAAAQCTPLGEVSGDAEGDA